MSLQPLCQKQHMSHQGRPLHLGPNPTFHPVAPVLIRIKDPSAVHPLRSQLLPSRGLSMAVVQ
ncbi:hypothetical protein BD324DRAFT_267794 [Kockovaella imperatae]|uniref:Uncharacterized protein n=1 Tax=Kockovaella imperatae TaxID=4999 RepID=A0A1Y1US00_9TREE|nr:hypothetical protein BD324DRAFT_267794 [Kockovaella imperatae]ORX40236.1 hypothetical protein BD324DRAFT_267794 [Kockovaella imperatae]